MAEIAETLVERGKRYGKFTGHAKVSQDLQEAVRIGFANRPDKMGLEDLDDDMREAIFMICHKMGRIVNGDPFYADSWVDIAGYAKLVSDRLEHDIET